MKRFTITTTMSTFTRTHEFTVFNNASPVLTQLMSVKTITIKPVGPFHNKF